MNLPEVLDAADSKAVVILFDDLTNWRGGINEDKVRLDFGGYSHKVEMPEANDGKVFKADVSIKRLYSGAVQPTPSPPEICFHVGGAVLLINDEDFEGGHSGAAKDGQAACACDGDVVAEESFADSSIASKHNEAAPTEHIGD